MESAETFDSPEKYLKAKRESQKLSLKEVADTTRIREPVLRALEEDRYANLPAIYVKSFLSTYAECLGLDSNEVIMVHQKITEKRSFSNDQVLKPPSTIQKKGVNGRLLVISISVVLLMALIVYASFELLR
jgi:cytoskeletal protein RodZ